MRRPLRSLLASVCLLAFAAPVAYAHQTAVDVQGKVVRVGGHRVEIDTHGDRDIPKGSDAGLKRLARRAALRSLRAGGGLGASIADAPPQLASTWCGIERSTDDTANVAASSGSYFKLLYVYPAGEPDRFGLYANLIQGDMRAINDVMVAASGGAKGIRFDVGTVCGNTNVDIASIQLAHTRAQFLAMGFDARLAALRADIAGSGNGFDTSNAAIGTHRNLLIYADGLYGNDDVAGVGSLFDDDRHGANNNSNLGGLTAVVFGNGGGNPAFAPDDRRQNTALHEISHTMGAVQDSAPHSTLAGHCTDLDDVMCYADGGPNNALTHPCPNATPSPYDCGKNDYFSPAPAGGSYLDLKWNVYNSEFLCAVASCIQAGNANSPPTAVARILRDGVETATATTGDTVVLDGGGSSDAQGPIASWAWAIGGATTTTRVGSTASLPLPVAGTYTITLTVKDGNGAPAVAVKTLVVTDPPVPADPGEGQTATTTTTSTGSGAPPQPESIPTPSAAPSSPAGGGGTATVTTTKPVTATKTAAKKPLTTAQKKALAKKKAAAKRKALARKKALAKKRAAAKRKAAAKKKRRR